MGRSIKKKEESFLFSLVNTEITFPESKKYTSFLRLVSPCTNLKTSITHKKTLFPPTFAYFYTQEITSTECKG